MLRVRCKTSDGNKLHGMMILLLPRLRAEATRSFWSMQDRIQAWESMDWFYCRGLPADALAKKRTRGPIVRRCGRDYRITTDPECL